MTQRNTWLKLLAAVLAVALAVGPSATRAQTQPEEGGGLTPQKSGEIGAGIAAAYVLYYGATELGWNVGSLQPAFNWVWNGITGLGDGGNGDDDDPDNDEPEPPAVVSSRKGGADGPTIAEGGQFTPEQLSSQLPAPPTPAPPATPGAVSAEVPVRQGSAGFRPDAEAPLSEQGLDLGSERANTDPVALRRGVFVHRAVDHETQGLAPTLALRRSYRSDTNFKGPFGPAWDHNFNVRIHLGTNPDVCASEVSVSLGELNAIAMRPEDGGDAESRVTIYRPVAPGLDVTLSRHALMGPVNECAWELRLTDASVYCFNQHRLATRLEHPNGNRLEIEWEEYERAGEQLFRVNRVSRRIAAQTTHRLSFEYDPGGAQQLRWTRLLLGERELSAVEYRYNGRGELEQVLASDRTVERYTYSDVPDPIREVPLEGLREFCASACSDTVPAGCGGATVCERAAANQGGQCPVACLQTCVSGCEQAVDEFAPREFAICRESGLNEQQCNQMLEEIRPPYLLGCYGSCAPACTRRCQDPAALQRACSGTCMDACMAQATDPEHVIYGSRRDLLHNIESISDAEGNLLVANEYGTNAARPDFDAVVHQRVGSHTATPMAFRYFDLNPPTPAGDEPAQIPSDHSFPEIATGEHSSSDVPVETVAQQAPTGTLQVCQAREPRRLTPVRVQPFANGRGLYALRPVAGAEASRFSRASSTLVFEVAEDGALRPRSPVSDLSGRSVAFGGLRGTLSDVGSGLVRLSGVTASQRLYASVSYDGREPEPGAKSPEHLYAIFASEAVQLGDRTAVYGSGSEHGSVVSTGGAGVQLGADTQVGDVISGGTVELRDRATVHGGVLSAQALTLGNGARVEGPTVTQATVAVTPPRLDVTFPVLSSDQLVESGSRLLEPGAYRHVLVRPNARLRLTAGSYYVETLTVESNASMDVASAGGPVRMFVRSGVTFRGRVEDAGRSDQLLLGYTGTEPIGIVEAPFRGTLLAPRALVRLQANGEHQGSFVARRVETQGGTLLRHVPFSGSWPRQEPSAVTWQDDERRLAHPADFTVPEFIPVLQGNAGNHWVQLSFGLGDATSIRCEWVGGSSSAHPAAGEQAVAGLYYRFRRCSNGATAGSRITADRLHLHLAASDALAAGGETRVTVRLTSTVSADIVRAPVPLLTGARTGDLVAFGEVGQALEPLGVVLGVAALTEGSCRSGFVIESGIDGDGVTLEPPSACSDSLRLIPLGSFTAESPWAGLTLGEAVVDLESPGSSRGGARRLHRFSNEWLETSDWSQAVSVLHAGGFDYLNTSTPWVPAARLLVPRTASELEATLGRVEEVAQRAPQVQREQVLAEIAQIRLDILSDLMSRGEPAPTSGPEPDTTSAALPRRHELKPAVDSLMRKVRMPDVVFNPGGFGKDCTASRPLREPGYAPWALPTARARWATVTSGPDRDPLISYYNRQGDNIRVVNTRRGVVDDMEYDHRHLLVGQLKHSVDSLDALVPRVCASYDERGLPTTATVAATDGSGTRTQCFEHSEHGPWLTSATVPGGERADLLFTRSVDSSGNVLTESQGLVSETQRFRYDPYGRQLSVLDPSGVVTTFSDHDPSTGLARLVIVDDTGFARTLRASYDAWGHLHTLTRTGWGPDETWSWHERFLDSYTVTDRQEVNATTTFDRYANGRLRALIDPFGTSSYEYTPEGHLSKVTRESGDQTRITCYKRRADGTVHTVIDPNGAAWVTSRAYHPGGVLTESTVVAGSDDDDCALPSSAIEGDIPAGAVRSVSRDRADRVFSVVDGTGTTTRLGYDEYGNPASSVRGSGSARQLTARYFDRRSRPMASLVLHGTGTRPPTPPDPARLDSIPHAVYARFFDYDSSSRVSRVRDFARSPNAGFAPVSDRSSRYTAATRTLVEMEQTTQGPFAVTSTFDTLGRLSSAVDSNGYAASYSYPDFLRRVGTQPGPDGTPITSEVRFTRAGAVKEASLAGRTVLTNTYAASGALESSSDGFSDTVIHRNGEFVDAITRYASGDRSTPLEDQSFGFNGRGQVDRVSVGGALDSRLFYDLLGRTVRETRPHGTRATTLVHARTGYLGASSLPERVTLPSGRELTYTYLSGAPLVDTITADASGVPNVAGPSTLTVDFDYDFTGGATRTATLLDAQNVALEQDVQVFDGAGRRVEERDDGAGHTVRRRYGLGGGLEQLTQNGQVFTYVRRRDGRLEAIRDASSQAVAGFAYQGPGLAERVAYANSVQQSRTFDSSGRITAQTVGSVSLGYGYGADNFTRLFSMSTNGSRRSLLLELDPSGRVSNELLGVTADTSNLVSGRITNTDVQGFASGAESHRTYSIDRANNWTLVATPGETLTPSPDRANAYQQTPYGPAAYDLDGRLVSAGPRRFLYDAFGQTAAIQDTGVECAYGYDALGRRSVETCNGVMTQFEYDGENVARLGGAPGSANTAVLHQDGLNTPLLLQDAASNRVYLIAGKDRSIRAAFGAAGELLETYEYTAFGAVTTQRHAGNGSGNRFGYHGHVHDPSTGLVQMRARYYAPQLGRFTVQDPIGLRGGTNRYGFVGNRPTDLWDPFGLAPNANPATSTLPPFYVTGCSTPECAYYGVNGHDPGDQGEDEQFDIDLNDPPDWRNLRHLQGLNLLSGADPSMREMQLQRDLYTRMMQETALFSANVASMIVLPEGLALKGAWTAATFADDAARVLMFADDAGRVGVAAAEGIGGAGRTIALDSNAFFNLGTLRSTGVVSASDTLMVTPHVQVELARRGVLAADYAAAGVKVVAESPVGAAVPASKLAQVLRGLGGPGARSASADALNVAEAAGAGADWFVTADAQVLRAFGGGITVPHSGGVFINVVGF